MKFHSDILSPQYSRYLELARSCASWARLTDAYGGSSHGLWAKTARYRREAHIHYYVWLIGRFGYESPQCAGFRKQRLPIFANGAIKNWVADPEKALAVKAKRLLYG